MPVDTPRLVRDAATDRWLVILLMLFAVLVRAPVAAHNIQSLRADVDNYHELAWNLIERGTFGQQHSGPSAYRPPLYPVLLAPLLRDVYYDFTGVVAMHVALGLVTVWLTAVVGAQWGLGRWRFLAAALVACDPILLKQSTVFMTETLATALAALAMAALTTVIKRPTIVRALDAGFVLGLCVLCRPTFLVFAIAALPALCWLLPQGKARRKIMVITVAALAMTLAPWTVRNWIEFGRPIVTTTHGGFTLALANNRAFYDHLRKAPHEPWDAESSGWAGTILQYPHAQQEELENNRESYALAWQTMRDEPRMFLRACVYRLSRFWGVLPLALPQQTPRERMSRYAIAVFYSVELSLALLGAWRLRRDLLASPWLFALLLAVSFTLVHTFYWTDMRMRAPVVPAVALAAAVGAAVLRRRKGERKASSDKDLRTSSSV
ncbi:MAG TPA: hypothetical protein VGN12_24450 [Pirellulales bacterium]